jgi:endonuclease VIII
MPEGDTIFRAARTLGKALIGERLTMCESVVPSVAAAHLEGHVVTHVEPRGKNLLIGFDDGRTLHTHMRMSGSWHIYRVGERWLCRSAAIRVVLGTPRLVAVCFSAPIVRVLSRVALATDLEVSQLGPDLLSPSVDLALARTNLQRDPDREIGDALMQQRHLAGIGNVYKSEALFLSRVSPFERVGALSDEMLDRLLLEAQKQLVRNATRPGPRATRVALAGPRVWVYLRAREACLVCRGVVEARPQGNPPRTTYFCPRCQPALGAFNAP